MINWDLIESYNKCHQAILDMFKKIDWHFENPTCQELREQIREIYKNSPYEGKYGLLVGNGLSERYWKLKAQLDELEKKHTYKIPVKVLKQPAGVGAGANMGGMQQ